MPLVDFIRPIPPLGLDSLAILWFGLGLASSAASLIFLGAFFPVVLATCSGVAVDSSEWRRCAFLAGDG